MEITNHWKARAEVLEVDAEKNTVKSKDYSKGGTRKTATALFYSVKDLWEKFEGCPNKKAVLKGIARDLGKMHSHGLAVHKDYALFDPWLVFEKKKGGSWARRVTDTGAIAPLGKNLRRWNAHLRSNRDELVRLVKAYLPELAEEVEDTYWNNFHWTEFNRPRPK